MTGAPEPGTVVWITGLSGAGKSSIARSLVGLMGTEGHPAILLDGDEVRAAIADPHVGHDRESRFANALRICRLAALLSRQGFDVVVATMSLFREVHAWNREHLAPYLEVFVHVDLDVLHRRDARGLYGRARNGDAEHVVGIHLEYDAPEEPDLVLENNAPLEDFDGLAREILARLVSTHLQHPGRQP